MRRIIAITQVTLDGVMQAPGGPDEDATGGFTLGGWFMAFADDVLGQIIEETMAVDFDMLLGRRTYDIFPSYWPLQDNAIARAFGKARKYVVTHRPEHLEWERTVPIGGDALDEIRRLKASAGPDLHVCGSSVLLQTLVAADLVDEYRLWIAPVVLGQGKRLFGTGVPPSRLSLIDARSTPSGIVVSTYRPAGRIPQATAQ